MGRRNARQETLPTTLAKNTPAKVYFHVQIVVHREAYKFVVRRQRELKRCMWHTFQRVFANYFDASQKRGEFLRAWRGRHMVKTDSEELKMPEGTNACERVFFHTLGAVGFSRGSPPRRPRIDEDGDLVYIPLFPVVECA
jgi:hypothetical protein